MSLLLPVLLPLLAILAATPTGAIDATIRGTNAPLEVELLLRDAGDDWVDVAHRSLPASTRRVRFDGLASGVYQLRVRGPQPTEQLGTKVAVGAGDDRRITIAIEPFPFTGRVTIGGTALGTGAILLRHRELQWSGAIGLAADGTFRVPLWQRGTFTYEVRAPALPTDYSFWTEVDGAPLAIDIPDGRITGIVRDAASGAPLAGALVRLQTNVEDREEHVRLTTGPEGRFDFAGIKYGKHTVRVFPPRHVEPAPTTFTLDASERLRELDVRVHAGRSVAVIVIDGDNDPVASAEVFAVTDGSVRARTMTDEDGRATVALPANEAATLFVVPAEGSFGVQRVGRDDGKGRLKIYLPRPASSLSIRATTTAGAAMPPLSLLMRYNGELVPMEVADALAVAQGLQLVTGPESEAHLRNIPTGSYEFWPYLTDDEAASIVASAGLLLAPIQVNVRSGENRIGVQFAPR
ncbi:MAG TPA: carboxypeptidase-like regulatory domain-containing protein [Thermoanaerobaculia bacterium]